MADSPPQTNKKLKRKGWFRGLLRVLTWVLGFLVLLCVGLYIHFLITRVSASDYLSPKYQVSFEIGSVKSVLQEWVNLDAAQVVVREVPQLGGLEKALLDLRSSELIKNPVFAGLLDVSADVMILPSGSPLLVLDADWRSMLTRWIPLALPLLSIKGLKPASEDSQEYFVFENESGKRLFFALRNNLLIVAFDNQTLLDSLGWHQKGEALSQSPTKVTPAPRDSKLRLSVHPEMVLSQVLSDRELYQKLDEAFQWQSDAQIGADVSNQNIRIDFSTKLASQFPLFQKLLTRNQEPPEAIRAMPDTTYLFSSVNLGEFLDLAHAFSYFQDYDVDALLKKGDETAKSFVGMDLQEFLWNWIGNEAGTAFLETSPDPVFFVTIKDRGALDHALDKLKSSLALTTDSSLILDGVRVPQIIFPPFLQTLMSLFQVKLETPYYLIQDNVLFLSVNPEALAKIVNDKAAGKTLSNSPDFQELSRDLGDHSGLFLYYDLDRTQPFFLKGKGVLPDILKLYNRGVAVLQHQGGDVDLKLLARKSVRKTATAFPGYPVALQDAASAHIRVVRLPGQNDAKALYVNQANQFVIRSLAGGETHHLPVEEGTSLLRGTLGGDLVLFSPGGRLYRVNGAGQLTSGFPVSTPFAGGFAPVQAGNLFFGFDTQENKVLTLNENGQVSPFAWVPPAPLRAGPAEKDGLLAFAPKTFDGSVFVVGMDGKVQSGWPVSGGGIASRGAQFFSGRQGTSVVFLAQKGQLNLWDLQGHPRPGFPVALPGVFASEVVFPKTRTGDSDLLCLSQDGTLFLVQENGQVRRSFQAPVNGRIAHVVLADVDKDGEDEIFVYGDKNSIEGFTLQFSKLPGFPLAASQEPAFLDLNFDGPLEMVAGSDDGQVYAYHLVK